MKYESYKRDLAVRILRRLGYKADDSLHTAVDSVMQTLDEFLPTDDSTKRGHTEFEDIVPVYKVDCPDCGNHGFDDAHQEYTDVHPFCGNCGYCFN